MKQYALYVMALLSALFNFSTHADARVVLLGSGLQEVIKTAELQKTVKKDPKKQLTDEQSKFKQRADEDIDDLEVMPGVVVDPTKIPLPEDAGDEDWELRQESRVEESEIKPAIVLKVPDFFGDDDDTVEDYFGKKPDTSTVGSKFGFGDDDEIIDDSSSFIPPLTPGASVELTPEEYAEQVKAEKERLAQQAEDTKKTEEDTATEEELTPEEQMWENL